MANETNDVRNSQSQSIAWMNWTITWSDLKKSTAQGQKEYEEVIAVELNISNSISIMAIKIELGYLKYVKAFVKIKGIS